jgi:hypothetical protein
MSRWMKRRPYWLFGAGFTLGLAVGAAMLVGALVGRAIDGMSELRFPETQLHATASDSGDTFAMATGMVSDGVEGVFFLDFLTGDLQCWVMNRRTGQLGGLFKHNVVADLGIDTGKKPKYLMVTGLAPFSRGSSAVRTADSLVYVADENTGHFAAYALPWNRNAAAANAPQAARMILVGKGAARTLDLRGR